MTLALFSLVPGTGHPISDFDYPESSRKKNRAANDPGLKDDQFDQISFSPF